VTFCQCYKLQVCYSWFKSYSSLVCVAIKLKKARQSSSRPYFSNPADVKFHMLGYLVSHHYGLCILGECHSDPFSFPVYGVPERPTLKNILGRRRSANGSLQRYARDFTRCVAKIRKTIMLAGIWLSQGMIQDKKVSVSYAVQDHMTQACHP